MKKPAPKSSIAKVKKARPAPDLEHERAHRAQGRLVVGVDEVGRGCLAGPVVTAAVILPEFVYEAAAGVGDAWWLKLNDSKLLRPALREQLAEKIRQHAQVHVAWCSVEEIDRWNILHAAMVAMRRSLEAFAGKAQAVLVDGHTSPFHPRYRCEPGEAERMGFSHVDLLIKGDQRSMSIAAASIVAKVYRDKWMAELDAQYPGYSFAEHKGYSTPVHYAAIEKLGACALHRLSFAPFSAKGESGPGDCTALAAHEQAGKQSQLFD